MSLGTSANAAYDAVVGPTRDHGDHTMSDEKPTHRCVNCGLEAVGQAREMTRDAQHPATQFHVIKDATPTPLRRCTNDPRSKAFPIHAMERIR